MTAAKSARHVRAGQARQRQFKETLEEDGYRAYQRAAYQAARRKYGPAWTPRCLTKAQEARRAWRIAHPTPGEAALASADWIGLADTATSFLYAAWCADGMPQLADPTVVREA